MSATSNPLIPCVDVYIGPASLVDRPSLKYNCCLELSIQISPWAMPLGTVFETIVPPLTLKLVPSYTLSLFSVVSNHNCPTIG